MGRELRGIELERNARIRGARCQTLQFFHRHVGPDVVSPVALARLHVLSGDQGSGRDRLRTAGTARRLLPTVGWPVECGWSDDEAPRLASVA
ncbi:MAG: hypothetical protein JWM76_1083 [Pseudonocardiales bacterium]|nr:hypothetical protein [Pseudonocardiales bacterium]